MSLQLARADLAYLNGTPFVDDLDHALAKLRTTLPNKTVNHLDRILKVFAPLPKPLRNYGCQASLLRDLRKAMQIAFSPGTHRAHLPNRQRACAHFW